MHSCLYRLFLEAVVFSEKLPSVYIYVLVIIIISVRVSQLTLGTLVCLCVEMCVDVCLLCVVYCKNKLCR